MSGFSTRVKLLEKWASSLLPQLKDLDDLADIILDVWNEAEADTEARIIKLLEKLICGECEMNGFENNIPNQAIALIKGGAE